MPGTLYIVATPIGNLSDFSQSMKDVLKNVDIVICEDTRVSKKILELADSKARLKSYYKFIENNTKPYIQFLLDGQDMALISDAGTPAIADPGTRLVNAAYDHNVDVKIISGPSAVTSALALSGFDSSQFAFLGFLPKKKAEILKCFHNYNPYSYPVVFFGSPHRLIKTIEILEELLDSDIRICCIKEMTKKFERVFRKELSQIKELLLNNSDALKGEWTIVLEKLQLKEMEQSDCHLSVDDIQKQFKVKRSQAAKIISIITKKSKHEVY